MPRLRVAILGTSFGRLVQAPAFQRHPGFELVAIAGRDREKTSRIAGELGVAAAYDDWRELLRRESPDVVSIVTPVFLHHPMMVAAAEAGAHVLCEKPTALHRFQAAAMRDAAALAGRVAGINHEFRFLPARRLATELVRQGSEQFIEARLFAEYGEHFPTSLGVNGGTSTRTTPAAGARMDEFPPPFAVVFEPPGRVRDEA